jgi:YVTN family beta-propeller protein
MLRRSCRFLCRLPPVRSAHTLGKVRPLSSLRLSSPSSSRSRTGPHARASIRLHGPRVAALLFAALALTSCHRDRFPSYTADYHEYAYITNGGSNTVTVLDLVNVRQDRTVAVGRQPTGLAVNPKRNEVYAVNTGSDSVSVLDAETNQVVATIPVHHSPYFISVDPEGRRAYVANAGSNTVSVLDLQARREIGVAAAGEAPGLAVVSPDNRIVVVSNRVAGSISLYTVDPSTTHPLHFREAIPGCPGATDIAILPDSTKAFVACSGAHQVMAVWLGVPADSWRGRQDATLQQDHLLAVLDVGKTPTHLAVKPDGGEVFSTNFGGNSLSEMSTWTNEVESTYPGVMQPSGAIISRDNASLWITDFGADSASLYSIDDGRIVASVHLGSHPDALAFSADEHLLLATDTGSSDVAVIRTNGAAGPTLFTFLPVGAQPNDIVTKAFHQH